MALPVVGLFMKKLYADPKLGYSQTEQFTLIPGYGICDKANEDGETPEEVAPEIEELFR